MNTALYFPQGTINLRYSSSAPVTFYAVFYDATTPAKTQVQVNVRTASDTTLLTRAAYTAPINSGDVIALSGTDAEIQVTLLTTDPTISPTLNSVKLRLLVKSEQNGFYIQNTSDWALGTTKNLTIAPLTGDLGQLEITTPINVGGIAFSYLQAIREIDSSNVAVFGFSGVRLPISPPQAFNWANNPYVGFDQPVSVVRQIDKTYLVADMNNDRVVLMDSSGNLIQGFASVNVTDANFYAFCSSYNPTTGVLTIILSQGVDNTSVSLPLISIYIGTTQIILGATDTIQQNNKNNQILEILLSEDKQAQLNGATQGRVTVNFTTGAFPAPFSSNPNSLGLIGVLGIQCFLGNITFIDGIQHPVAANILANGDWIIANSTIEYTPPPSGATGTTAALKSNPTSISVTANSQATATVSGGTGPYNIKTGPDSSIATASLSGNQVQIQGTATGKTNVVIQDSSTLPLTLSIAINVVAGTTAAPTVVTIASLLQINPKTQAVDFSSSILSYSDFTLGAVEEVNADRIAVAGLVVDPASLNSNTGSSSSGSTGPVIDPTLPPAEYYRQSAIAALSTYRGIVGIIDKPSNNMIFQYLSPDGLYASDVDLDEDGNLIVAESSFTGAAGRVIVLDPFGNIIRLYGEGMFGTINDAKSVGNGNILISV